MIHTILGLVNVDTHAEVKIGEDAVVQMTPLSYFLEEEGFLAYSGSFFDLPEGKLTSLMGVVEVVTKHKNELNVSPHSSLSFHVMQS